LPLSFVITTVICHCRLQTVECSRSRYQSLAPPLLPPSPLPVLIVVAIAITIELLVIATLGCWHCHRCQIQQSGYCLSVIRTRTLTKKKEAKIRHVVTSTTKFDLDSKYKGQHIEFWVI